MRKILLMPTDSINDALAELNDNEPLELVLSPGIYRQKIKITRSNLLLRGLTPEKTIIVYNDFNYKFHKDGLLYNTFRTPTLTITGSNVILENLTIQNDAGFGPKIGQAVALALYGDENILDNCILKGHQDTLFIGPLPTDLAERYAHILDADERMTKPGRHIITNTYIEGDVDFIFGSGNVLFKRCNIHQLKKGYVTAPSHYNKDALGFIFDECEIINDSHEEMILARPWRDYGRVSFINCNIKGASDVRYDTWGKQHYYFFEFPYVKNDLSTPLKEAKIKELLDPKTWS